MDIKTSVIMTNNLYKWNILNPVKSDNNPIIYGTKNL